MDQNLEKEIATYAQLAKDDKTIDAAGLMMNALNRHQSNLLPDRQKYWAYIISVAFPPFGLLFALKFYFSDADDGKKAAYICISLTAAAIIFLIVLTQMLFSSSGVDTQQLQQLNPEDIRSLVE